MPVMRNDEIVTLLMENGVSSRIGNFLSDVDDFYRPYFERWLKNRDGFLTILDGNIDYVGSEEVMRFGPFHNMYCLICNMHLMETDVNHGMLLNAAPFYRIIDGIVDELGWSGSVLAERLNKDERLYRAVRKKILNEEVRSISVRVVNYACLIESKAWDPVGFVSAYLIIDEIGGIVRNLLTNVHLGEKLNT
jgi:hypothetical protein